MWEEEEETNSDTVISTIALKYGALWKLTVLGRKTDMRSQKREDKVQRESLPDIVQRKSRPNSAQVGGVPMWR